MLHSTNSWGGVASSVLHMSHGKCTRRCHNGRDVVPFTAFATLDYTFLTVIVPSEWRPPLGSSGNTSKFISKGLTPGKKLLFFNCSYAVAMPVVLMPSGKDTPNCY